MSPQLPEFVAPMLAKLGQAFDSDEHLFELKWDGIRAIGFVEGIGYRLTSRRQIDLTGRFPEFAFMEGLPPGTVLDGEIVVLEDGKPSFERVMSRERAHSAIKIESLVSSLPATYVVFDLLYRDYDSLMDRELVERRAALTELVAAHPHQSWILSEGLVGDGLALFEEVRARDIEGVVAKRLKSRYVPGMRSESWIKAKKGELATCAILGYLPEGEDDLKSLIIAVADEDGLRCVGKVGSGLSGEMRARLLKLMRSRQRETPLVGGEEEGLWVEPGLYCTVSYLERTKNGSLRAPVFVKLIS